jgi:PPOX class probable F420-dependent enzyme
VDDIASLTAALAAEPFVDFVTFREDSSDAHTPVWVSGDADRIFISTFGHSYKVARARLDPRVAVAACDGPGALLPGAHYIAGRAEVINKSEFRVGVRAHKAKYGKHFAIMWPARWPLRLIGKRRVWIVVTLTPGAEIPTVSAPKIRPAQH